MEQKSRLNRTELDSEKCRAKAAHELGVRQCCPEREQSLFSRELRHGIMIGAGVTELLLQN